MEATLVINETDEAPEWDQAPDSVRKIVLGELGEPKELGGLPPNLHQRFPALTHLHLWGCRGIERLPPLPAGLKCLDVRNCPDLREVSFLPASLEELVLEKLPAWEGAGLEGVDLPNVWDLSLRDCSRLPEAVIDKILTGAPKLRDLDLSGCEQLERVRAWPAELERIELNRCERLWALPARWPAALRRLGLRGARALRTLPPPS